MPKIILNVKNTEVLKNYFQKFTHIGNAIFITVKKDRFVSISFTETKDFIKIASLKFSDVFEESEIDIDNDIYIGLYSKIKRLIMSVSQFPGPYKLILNIKPVNEKSVVNLIKDAGYTENDTIDVVEFLQFKDSRLNLITKGSKFSGAINNIFDLTTPTIESIFGENDSVKKGEFILEKNDFKQLKTLADSVETKVDDALLLNIDSEKCKMHISSKGSFDFKFAMLECIEDFEFAIGSDSLKYLDGENVEICIKDHQSLGPILIANSQESDTKYSFASYNKPG